MSQPPETAGDTPPSILRGRGGPPGRGGFRGRGTTSPPMATQSPPITDNPPSATPISQARGGGTPPRGRGRGGSPQPPIGNPQSTATPTDFSRRNSHQGSEASVPTPSMDKKSPAPLPGKTKSPAPLPGKKSPAPLMAGKKGPPTMAGKKVPISPMSTAGKVVKSPLSVLEEGSTPHPVPPPSTSEPIEGARIAATSTSPVTSEPPPPPPDAPEEDFDPPPLPPSPPRSPIMVDREEPTRSVKQPDAPPPASAPIKANIQEKVTAVCRVCIAIDSEITAGVDWKQPQNRLRLVIAMNQKVRNILQAVQSKYRLDNILDVAIPVGVKGKSEETLEPNPQDVIQLNLTPVQLGWRPDSYNWVWFRTKLPRDEGDPAMQQLTLKQWYLQRVQRIYEYYDPRKLNTSEAVVDDFEGSEDLMMVQLVGKYGPEPTADQLRKKRVYNIGPAVKGLDATPQSIMAEHATEKERDAENKAALAAAAKAEAQEGKQLGKKGPNKSIKGKRQERTEVDRNRALEALLSRSDNNSGGGTYILRSIYLRKWMSFIRIKRERNAVVAIMMHNRELDTIRTYFDKFKLFRITNIANKQVTASDITRHKSDSLVGDLQADNMFLKGEVKKLQTQVELLDSTNARRLETLCNSSELAINQIKALTLECQAKEQVIIKLEKKLMGVGNMALAASEKKDFALQTAIAAQVETEEKYRVATDRIAEIEHAYAQSQAEVRRLKKKNELRKKLLAGHVANENELKSFGDSTDEEGTVPVQKECRHCIHYARQKAVIDSHQKTNEELRNKVDDLEKTLQKMQAIRDSCEEENAILKRDLRNAMNNAPTAAPTIPANTQPPSTASPSSPLTKDKDVMPKDGGVSVKEAEKEGSKGLVVSNASIYSAVSSSAAPVPASIQAIIDSASQNNVENNLRRGLSSTLTGQIPPSQQQQQQTSLAPFRTYDGSTNPSWGYSAHSAIPQLLHRADPLPNNVSAPARMVDFYKAEAQRNSTIPNSNYGPQAPSTAETRLSVAPRLGHSDLAGNDLSLQKFFAVDAAVGQERIMMQMDRQLHQPRVGLLPHERDKLVKERELERRALLKQSMNGMGGAFAADFMQAKSALNAPHLATTTSGEAMPTTVHAHHNSGQYRVAKTDDRLAHYDPSAPTHNKLGSFHGYESMLRQGDSTYTSRQAAIDDARMLGSTVAGAGERPKQGAGDRYKYDTVPITGGLRPMRDMIFNTKSVLPPSTR